MTPDRLDKAVSVELSNVNASLLEKLLLLPSLEELDISESELGDMSALSSTIKRGAEGEEKEEGKQRRRGRTGRGGGGAREE